MWFGAKKKLEQQGDGTVAVSFKKRVMPVAVAGATTLGDLQAELARIFQVDASTIKLLLPGGRQVIPSGQPQTRLAAAGIHPGAKVRMSASSAASLTEVQRQQEAPATAGFDHELERELRRGGHIPSSGGSTPHPPAGPYTFQRYEAWQRPGLTPPPAEALKLLHRLAADAGIAAVMRKHNWTVGLLSEMPPEGKVGVSPVCILGVNINRGQEVTLRLRTDDLKGFRRYDRIKETLLHELAHMVYGSHDTDFKELNSQLRRECAALDWRASPAGHALSGETYAGPAMKYDLPQKGVMAATADSSGKTLGQLAGDGGRGPAQQDARAAAAAAALQRSGQAQSASPAPAAPQQQQQSQQSYKKGDAVLYRQRDGSWVEAKVAAVDSAVLPPSYGIELNQDGEVHYRETEASRLQPVLPAAAEASAEREPAAVVEGLGHRDAATEAKEDAMRRLEV